MLRELISSKMNDQERRRSKKAEYIAKKKKCKHLDNIKTNEGKLNLVRPKAKSTIRELSTFDKTTSSNYANKKYQLR